MLFFCTLCFLPLAVFAAVSNEELVALTDLYSSTNGEKWGKSTNWLEGDPCENKWYGIKCDATLAHVVGMELQQDNLGGSLPASFGNLTSLVEASLDCGNHIGGSIPTSVGNMRELLVWTTANDPLTGSIPDEMCNLKQLQILHIGMGQLTGKIPDCMSFMGDRDFGNCGMSGNNFDCPIPEWARIKCGATCK